MADRVLIADDDQAVSTMLSKVVHSNGTDGFEVVQAIRSRGLKTPIIIVSGRKEDFDTLYGLDIGADDYVTKPSNPQHLKNIRGLGYRFVV